MEEKNEIHRVSHQTIILDAIFTKKDWTVEEKKLWCNFVKYLDEQHKINEPLFIQKLQEKKALERSWGNVR